MKKFATTSVYANPVHPGHIECMELSKTLADELIVSVNNDDQVGSKTHHSSSFVTKRVDQGQERIPASREKDTFVTITEKKV